jgi:hypothetical protein
MKDKSQETYMMYIFHLINGTKRGWDKTYLLDEKAGEILRRVKFYRL